MPSLGDQIVKLFKAGAMPNPMCTADVFKRFSGKYADKYINVVLANYEATTGDYVKKGRRALFRRVAEGRYVAL